MVLTPGGYLPAANVKAVPAGGHVAHVGNDIHLVDSQGTVIDVSSPTKATISHRVKRFVSGWTAYADWYNTGSPINYFVTTWAVPNTPATASGQTLFYFNSIEPASGTAILQPVLQVRRHCESLNTRRLTNSSSCSGAHPPLGAAITGRLLPGMSPAATHITPRW